MTDQTDPILEKAEEIIAAFGGIRPMAKSLGVAVTTVQGWKERGVIPIARLDDVRDAAAREGIDLADLKPAAKDTDGSAGSERVEPKPDVGVRAAASGERPPPVIDQSGAPSGTGGGGGNAGGGSDDGPARNRQGHLFLLAACMIGAAGLGAVLVWVWMGGVPGAGGGGEGALARRVADLEKRLAAAEQTAQAADTKAGNASVSTQELVRVSRTLGGLEQRLAALSEQVKAGGGKALTDAVNRLAAMEKTVQRLSAEVAAASQKASASAAASGDPKAIARLVAQTAALQKSLAAEGKALRAAIARVDAEAKGALKQAAARLAALETRTKSLAEAAHRRTSLLLALGQLRQAARSGKPFRPALEAARGFAADDGPIPAALKKLDPHADKGAPTLTALQERFDPLTARIIRRTKVAAEGDWLDRMWARVESLVVVRRTGRGVEGDGIAAQIARAENALKDGRLAEAVRIVGALPPAAVTVTRQWLADARARLAVDAALADLARQAVKLVGAPAGAGGGKAE